MHVYYLPQTTRSNGLIQSETKRKKRKRIKIYFDDIITVNYCLYFIKIKIIIIIQNK